jgi:beta-N-acetylhexosaminidase
MSAGAPGGAAISLHEAAGQVLMVGVEGAQLTPLEASWLRLMRPAGVILFRRNLESAGQARALLQSLQAFTPLPVLRAIDMEGGSVDRLRDMFRAMPSPAAVAATGRPDLFAAHGQLIGRELRALGLHATFAPVLDLKTPRSGPVMQSRVIDGPATAVAAYARQFLTGLKRENILGCGKHFPGLGDGEVDSHQTTPRIAKSFDRLWREDLLPYRRLAQRLALVMVAHAQYPSTPSGQAPASVSPYWVSEVLGQKIGFDGLVVSDDMEMGGILGHCGMAEAAVLAVAAGTHLVEICRDPSLIFGAYEGLLREAERSAAFARRLRAAAARVRSFRSARLRRDPLRAAPPSPASLRRLGDDIRRFSERVERRNGKATA